MMLCVKCGLDIDDGILCRECFESTHEILKAPEHLDIDHCTNCGKFLLRGDRWTNSLNDAVWQNMRSMVEAPEEIDHISLEVDVDMEGSEGTAVLHLSGTYFSEPVESTGTVDIRIKNRPCTDCSRLSGQYFEAIIQIRGEYRLSDEELEDAAKVIGKHAVNFINRIEEVRGGLDIYMTSHKQARLASLALARRHATRMKESSSLFGMREGKEIYRHTMLVRIPRYDAGCVIRYNDKIYYIANLGRTNHLIDLMTGKHTNVQLKILEESMVIATVDDQTETVVVAVEDSGVMILDPVSGKTITILTPFEVNAGDPIITIRSDEDIIVLPPSHTTQKPEPS